MHRIAPLSFAGFFSRKQSSKIEGGNCIHHQHLVGGSIASGTDTICVIVIIGGNLARINFKSSEVSLVVTKHLQQLNSQRTQHSQSRAETIFIIKHSLLIGCDP